MYDDHQTKNTGTTAKMKTTGLNNILNNLSKLDITSRVEGVVNDVGEQILGQAKNNVHVLTGDLKNSLNMRVIKDGDSYVIGVGSDLFYAIFEEVGTGGNVRVPAEFAEYAKEFYVSGKGHNMPHPYLFPAYYQHRPKLAVKLAQLINSMTK